MGVHERIRIWIIRCLIGMVCVYIAWMDGLDKVGLLAYLFVISVLLCFASFCVGVDGGCMHARVCFACWPVDYIYFFISKDETQGRRRNFRWLVPSLPSTLDKI